MKKWIIFIGIVLVIALYIWWGSNTIMLSNFEYQNAKIPKELNEFRIAQISDLHNKKFKNFQGRIKRIDPDIIVITGDLIDRSKRDMYPEVLAGLAEIASTYYVFGNHDTDNEGKHELKEKAEALGVKVLMGKKVELCEGAMLLGIEDRLLNPNVDGVLKELSDTADFQILLSHRPELIDSYAKSGVDLVFTGHAHGGAIRLPFIGAIVAPNQRIFPKYTSGKYVNGDTTMIVSRGLGNSSSFPARILNRPEIVVLELKSEM